jgi:hypothetical protein
MLSSVHNHALASFLQKDMPAEHKVEQGHFSIFIFSLGRSENLCAAGSNFLLVNGGKC